MILTLRKSITLMLICLSVHAVAQKAGRDFTDVDAEVKKLGSLDSMNMGTISNLVTKNYTNKTDKARAIYDWVAYNINYDLKSAKSGATDKNSSTQVLLYRKATGAGYANLFQDMCSSAGIRCLTADGFVKYGPDEINNTKTEINHTWAVVQLGESPEAWYYVDACWGAGYTDAEFKTFTKLFNPDYFFADLTIFNWQHFPDNIAWYLGPRLKNKKDFFGMPIIKSAAYAFGLKKMNPLDGAVKAKVKKAFPFSYQLASYAEVNKVAIAYGEGKKRKVKEVPFTFSNNLLGFTYTFDDEDNLPVTILVNDKILIEYNFDIE
jgi:hypothetical protein